MCWRSDISFLIVTSFWLTWLDRAAAFDRAALHCCVVWMMVRGVRSKTVLGGGGGMAWYCGRYTCPGPPLGIVCTIPWSAVGVIGTALHCIVFTSVVWAVWGVIHCWFVWGVNHCWFGAVPETRHGRICGCWMTWLWMLYFWNVTKAWTRSWLSGKWITQRID